MGTFVGHLVPGIWHIFNTIALLGIWHIFNTINAYFQKGPKKFTSKLWYPLKSPLMKLHHLELILILCSSIFTTLMQMVDFPSLRFSLSLLNLEHSTMFLHLSIFTCFTLFAELTHSSEALWGISGILVSSVFVQELFMLFYHSADHVGLEGHCHFLLQLIVCVSVLAAVSSTVCPTNVPAALVLRISVVFQGFWFMNMGFNLWFPTLSQKVAFHMEAWSVRRMKQVQGRWRWQTCNSAGYSAAILMLTSFISLVLSLVCARNGALRVQSSQYEQLHNRAADASIDEVARTKLGHV